MSEHDPPDNITHIRDERWIEVGSADWQHEVMEAINEVMVRVSVLEDAEAERSQSWWRKHFARNTSKSQ
jgi:hypothetical protein